MNSTHRDLPVLLDLVKNVQNAADAIPRQFTDIKGYRAASVALILRLCPAIPVTNSNAKVPTLCTTSNRASADDLRAYFEACPWAANSQLQLLYIRRADNPRDPWSGQVAFPGGRHEEGETEYETAVRETREEVGIDLSDSNNFAFVGEIGRRLVVRTDVSRHLVVSPFVFVQLCPVTPSVNLQVTEIAGFRWTPVSFFLQSKQDISVLKPLPLTRGLPLLSHLPMPLRTLAGLHQVSFISYLLPPPSVAEPRPVLTAGGVNASSTRKEGVLPDAEGKFQLWGLTLWMTADLLHRACLRPKDHQYDNLGTPVIVLHGPFFPLTAAVTRTVMKLGYFPPLAKVIKWCLAGAGVGAVVICVGVSKMLSLL